MCYTGGVHVSANIIDDQVKNYEKQDSFKAMCEVKALAYAMKDELLKGNLNAFGKLLDYSWNSKKRMSNKISNPAIDALYDRAKAEGAIGGKLLGAGGGGFLLIYCPFNARHKVAAGLEDVGGQILDWNFELRGVQTWTVDNDRWDYKGIDIRLPEGNFRFDI